MTISVASGLNTITIQSTSDGSENDGVALSIDNDYVCSNNNNNHNIHFFYSVIPKASLLMALYGKIIKKIKNIKN